MEAIIIVHKEKNELFTLLIESIRQKDPIHLEEALNGAILQETPALLSIATWQYLIEKIKKQEEIASYHLLDGFAELLRWQKGNITKDVWQPLHDALFHHLLTHPSYHHEEIDTQTLTYLIKRKQGFSKSQGLLAIISKEYTTINEATYRILQQDQEGQKNEQRSALVDQLFYLHEIIALSQEKKSDIILNQEEEKIAVLEKILSYEENGYYFSHPFIQKTSAPSFALQQKIKKQEEILKKAKKEQEKSIIEKTIEELFLFALSFIQSPLYFQYFFTPFLKEIPKDDQLLVKIKGDFNQLLSYKQDHQPLKNVRLGKFIPTKSFRTQYDVLEIFENQLAKDYLYLLDDFHTYTLPEEYRNPQALPRERFVFYLHEIAHEISSHRYKKEKKKEKLELAYIKLYEVYSKIKDPVFLSYYGGLINHSLQMIRKEKILPLWRITYHTREFQMIFEENTKKKEHLPFSPEETKLTEDYPYYSQFTTMINYHSFYAPFARVFEQQTKKEKS